MKRYREVVQVTSSPGPVHPAASLTTLRAHPHCAVRRVQRLHKSDEMICVCEPAVPRSPLSLPMRLLGAGVPLSLLIDLVAPNGPDSISILRREGSTSPA